MMESSVNVLHYNINKGKGLDYQKIIIKILNFLLLLKEGVLI